VAFSIYFAHSRRLFVFPQIMSVSEHKSSLKTTVVRLRRVKGVSVQPYDVYIGRRLARGGWDLPQSKWANPFTVGSCGSASAAVAKYKEWLAQPAQAALCASIASELRGKRLGCWCKNKPDDPCHGDILAAIADGTSSAGSTA
jgi:hypothetical protein